MPCTCPPPPSYVRDPKCPHHGTAPCICSRNSQGAIDAVNPRCPVHVGAVIPIRAKSKSDIVEVMEGLLERARAGDFKAITFIATTTDGNAVQAFAGGGPLLTMLGAVDVAHAYLVRYHQGLET